MRKANKVQNPIIWLSDGLEVSDPDDLDIALMWKSILVGLIPIAINGGLSHFRRGHSTSAQGGWTMTWLAFGVVFGYFIALASDGPFGGAFGDIVNFIPIIGSYFLPAIGGFVVVAQMLMSYGSCIEIGEANI